MNLTQEELRTKLRYCPGTGTFEWKVFRGGVVPGSPAGTTDSEGYIVIMINRKSYRSHRLAWLYMTGEWPPQEIDHINRIVGDNRWVNLRQATRTQNNINVRLRSDNSSGLRGLFWRGDKQRWIVNVRGEEGTHYSTHRCKLDAVSTLYRLQRILHGEFSV